MSTPLKIEKLLPLKFDKQKTRLELIPPEFLEATGRGLTYGASKYAAGNWATGEGFEWSRLYGALLRHLNAWNNGEDVDNESGNHHLDHACCMLSFLVAHVARNHGLDDRLKNGVSFRSAESEESSMPWMKSVETVSVGGDT